MKGKHMTSIRKRHLAMLLILGLAFSLVPNAYATGMDIYSNQAVSELSVPIMEESATSADSETAESSKLITPKTIEDCASATWATIWVKTSEYCADEKETNKYIYYEFPAGTKRKRNNIGLRAIKVNGVWQAAYCLEPGIEAGSQYTTEEMTRDEFLASPYVPATLSKAQLDAMCIAALYGQHSLPQSANYEDLSNMLATQIIIWEIATGYRDCYPPYAQTDDTFM